VPRLIAMGHSSVDAAASLAITVRTIQKHLEHFYRACCSRRSC
jgi:DNA-binding CsgD family transcriptional regulator